MKSTGLKSPFLDGEVLGAPATPSPFEFALPEPARQPMPELAASGLRIVDGQGQPLAGAAWRVHQGNAVFKGSTDSAGETGLLAQAGKAFDRNQSFRLHVEGHVCSIVSGATLRVDEPGVEYGGSRFDWTLADHNDPAQRNAFWKDYRERRARDERPGVFQFLQHDHVMRRPVRYLRGTGLAVFQAEPLAIRLGPLVRHTDDRRARIWLELSTPGLVRVVFGAAAQAHAKPGPDDAPPQPRSRHASSVRVGGRHFALLTLDDLPADAVVQYTLELAPQPPTGPLPLTEIDFTEASFPRQLPAAVLLAQRAPLKAQSLSRSHWLFLRTLPRSSEGLRFAHGSCRVYPNDADDQGRNAGADMLEHFGTTFLSQQGLEQWPQFFMHTGDQIYADDIGKTMGAQVLRERFAAALPGPRAGDDLLRGAWAGRFALRHVSRKVPLPPPPKANLDEVRRNRLAHANAFQIEDLIDRAETAARRQAVHAPVVAPPAQKLQVLNHLLWQVPVEAADMPRVDARLGLLMPQVFRIKGPPQRDLRLAHPAAGDMGGVHAADFAEYAALHEQAWGGPGARRALAHLPNYMIFDDHEVTDDWNASPRWLARVHDRADPLRMWPTTMTDALAAYWLYQGWGNLAPEVAAADPRVQILDRARASGHDALPELRRLIHDQAIQPLRPGARRGRVLAWNYRVPTGGIPFLVVDLRTDRDVNGDGGMSAERLNWLETALRAARTPSAFVVLPVPMLMPAPLMFAMNHPGVPAFITGAPSVEAFKLSADIEHPITNKVWDQIKGLLQRLQQAGSPLKTLALVSGDIHFSCNVDAQIKGSHGTPRLLQLVSSGLRKDVSKGKQSDLAAAYRGWLLHAISRAEGVEEQRGLVLTLGGLHGPGGKTDNFVFPTSVALVQAGTTPLKTGGGGVERHATVLQTHLTAGPQGTLPSWLFQHRSLVGGRVAMSLHDPSPPPPGMQADYPRSTGGVGIVNEADPGGPAEHEADSEGADFELRHGRDDEADPALELLADDEAGEPALQGEWDDGAPAAEAEAPAEPAFEAAGGTGFESTDGPGPQAEEEIIGPDARTRVTDPLALPHRWICALDVKLNLAGLGHIPEGMPDHARATGVLIGPRHVLTAGHVVNQVPVQVGGQRYFLPAREIVVTPARCGNNDQVPVVQATARVMRVSRKYERSVRLADGTPHGVPREDDIALLILKDDIAGTPHKRFRRLGWWGEDPTLSELRVLDPRTLAQGEVTVAGYAGDTCGKAVLKRDDPPSSPDRGVGRRIDHCRRQRRDEWAAWSWQSRSSASAQPLLGDLLYEADTYEGQSGAPVFAQRDGVWQLLAVHHGTSDPHSPPGSVPNLGTTISAHVLDELCQWINEDAGRPIASVRNGRLVFATGPQPVHEDPGEPADESAPEEAPAWEADSPDGDTTPRPVRQAAARISGGLRAAERWLRSQARSGAPELLRFAVSLLRTHFFPSGHGVLDAAGRVLKPAPAARIAMKLRLRDGSSAPFEHRVRLWISERAAESALVAGRHSDARFSAITLYAPAFAGLPPSVALQHAVHELLHMLFTLVERLRQRHGDAMADAFLQHDPWRLLDLRPHAARRAQLQQQLGPLLHLLGSPEPAADAAGRLIEEAFAYTLSMHLRFELDAAASPGSHIVASSVTDVLVKHYLLDRAPRLSSLLGTAELARATAPLRPLLDGLQDVLNAAWQRRPALSAEAPAQALFEPS